MNARRLLQACFAAGTPLLTPQGSKPIEQIQPGELVLARAESGPQWPAEPQLVEEVFVTTGRILHLHVGGQVIRTTPEHPFWVQGEGWLAAGLLRPGDLLSSHEGGWTAVEEVFDTGEFETVYNLRVAEWHTYFVGAEGWGFSVWAHNACKQDYSEASIRDLGKRTGFDKAQLAALNLTPSQITKVRALARNIPTNPQDPNSAPLLAKAGNRGKAGDAAHQATIGRLKQMAEAQFPNDQVHLGTSIKNVPGSGGLHREPDVWVQDATTRMVKQVYEAARREKSTGNWVKRERDKLADYNSVPIPSHFEEVK